jgi:hypothetical protein
LLKNKKKLALIVSSLTAALLLVLVLTVLLLPKDSTNGNGDEKGDRIDGISEILKNISDSDPDVYLCELEYVKGEVTLHGKYKLTLGDPEKNGGKLEYEYDRLGKAGTDDSFIVKESGTLYADKNSEVGEMKDGSIIWNEEVIDIDFSPIRLEKKSLKNAELSEKSGAIVLKATLDKSIVGYEAKCTLECDKETGNLLGATLFYTDSYGASVTVRYSYSYATVRSVNAG